jgi:hypothetical protein
MVKSALDTLQDAEVLNLSFNPRPPTFPKRASGQFIIGTVLASLLAIGVPLMYLVPAYMTDAYNLKLKSDNDALSKEAGEYKQILKEKQVLIKADKKELKNLEAIFEGKAKTLISIHSKKVNYKFKSGFLYRFGKDLKKFDVHVEEIYSNEDNFTLHLLSRDEKKMTAYIKYVSKTYFEDIESIDIKRIEIDDKDFAYRGILKVRYR